MSTYNFGSPLSQATPAPGNSQVSKTATVEKNLAEELSSVLSRHVPNASLELSESVNLLSIRSNPELMKGLNAAQDELTGSAFRMGFTVFFASSFSIYWSLKFLLCPSIGIEIPFGDWATLTAFSIMLATFFAMWSFGKRKSYSPLEKASIRKIENAGWDAKLLDAHRGMIVSGVPVIPELVQMVSALKTSKASTIVYNSLGEQDSLGMFRFTEYIHKYSDHAMKIRMSSAPKPQLILTGDTQELLSRVCSALEEREALGEDDKSLPLTYTI